MNCTTAMVSAQVAPKNEREIEEIRQKLETMTEAQRMEYLFWLREMFYSEQKKKLGIK